MALGGWPRLPKGIPDDAAFSVQVLNVTPVALSFVAVIFAIVTQLLAAAGAISVGATQQLTMWLVALGFIVLLSIAYMACHAYLTARARLEARLDRRPANAARIGRDDHNKLGPTNGRFTNMQTDGDGRPEQADKAEQARCALAKAEEQLKRAKAQAVEAEQEATAARERAVKAEQEATAARERAVEAEREAKVQLADDMASKIADWKKD